MTVEYRVRPVTRYIVTRFHEEDSPKGKAFGCDQRGEFDNAVMAYSVAYALCKLEHDLSGEPLDSANFVYPVDPMQAGEPLDSAAFVYPGALNDPSGCVDTAGRTRTRPRGWDEPATLTVDVRGATGNAEIQRMVSEGVAKGMRRVEKDDG
jgi:hypothetical protein